MLQIYNRDLRIVYFMTQLFTHFISIRFFKDDTMIIMTVIKQASSEPI